jgi:RNA polymerase sigma-70 factor (ECF subfamily)
MTIPLPFETHHSYLFAVAYRMLGSVTDTEDILQEAFLRWQKQPQEGIREPRAYLTSIVTRLCLEHMRKAHVRRETYVGPWLPEPFVDHEQTHPEALQSMAESLSQAFLLVLETLSPIERAVFLLREVFDYTYAEISEIVEKNESHCRQIAHRAKARVQQQRPRFTPSPAEHGQIVMQFLTSCMEGDMDGLLDLLAEQATFTSDSNGKAKAARNIITDAHRIARLVLGLSSKVPPNATIQFARLNGQLGIVMSIENTVVSTIGFQIENGKIQSIYNTVNPDKLKACQASLHPAS